MGRGGTMGSKGGASRKMAAAVAGGSGLRERAVSAARLLALFLVAALSLFQVSAVEVYTPPELSVENGTEAKLSCTFKSSEVISSAASVTWSFQAEGSTTSVSFFYYSNGKAYPGTHVPFKDRISWAGDLNKKDASINIANMQFLDSGAYICDVKNPPDIVVTPGEIQLRVVERGPVGPLQECLRQLQNLEERVENDHMELRSRLEAIEKRLASIEQGRGVSRSP